MPRPILLVVKGADRLLSLVVLGASGVAAAAIFIMAVLMAANVISRQVFDRPFLDTVLLGELSVVVLLACLDLLSTDGVAMPLMALEEVEGEVLLLLPDDVHREYPRVLDVDMR